MRSDVALNGSFNNFYDDLLHRAGFQVNMRVLSAGDLFVGITGIAELLSESAPI